MDEFLSFEQQRHGHQHEEGDRRDDAVVVFWRDIFDLLRRVFVFTHLLLSEHPTGRGEDVGHDSCHKTVGGEGQLGDGRHADSDDDGHQGQVGLPRQKLEQQSGTKSK